MSGIDMSKPAKDGATDDDDDDADDAADADNTADDADADADDADADDSFGASDAVDDANVDDAVDVVTDESPEVRCAFFALPILVYNLRSLFSAL